MTIDEIKKCSWRVPTHLDLSNKKLVLFGDIVGMGDWAVSTVGFRELKKKFPGLSICVIYGRHNEQGFFDCNPTIDYAMHVDKITKEDLAYLSNVDYGVNLISNDPVAWHTKDGKDPTFFERHFNQWGLPIPEDTTPIINIPQHYLSSAEQDLYNLDLVPGRTIIFHCGATNPELRWYPHYVSRFAEMAATIGFRTAVIGFKREFPIETRYIVNCCDKWSIMKNLAVMQVAGYFLSGSSGFLYAGGGLPIKQITMFAYPRHWYMWSARLKNSYELYPSREKPNKFFVKITPELIFEIFQGIVNGKIHLPINQIVLDE